MEPSHRCEMDAIGHQVLAGEAGHQVEVLRPYGRERCRKTQCDLGQVLAVPLRLAPVQRWHNHDLEKWDNVETGIKLQIKVGPVS